MRVCYLIAGVFVCASAAWSSDDSESIIASQRVDFFERKIRPALIEHCFECHEIEAESIGGGLRLDFRRGLIDGGDSGPAVVPGDAAASLLVEAIRYESLEMPPQGKLPDALIDDFQHWIDDGAVWPDEPEPIGERSEDEFDLQRRRASHWAWQPIRTPVVPDVGDSDWCDGTSDCFIAERHASAGMTVAKSASASQVARRLFFDLIGLPPTIRELEQFHRDCKRLGSERALARLTDQLLASPHFGEHWARHWLDLVRYAESRGHEFDVSIPNAYHYRDYVIDALNDDVPYDQFVIEHIAGDLLDPPRTDSRGRRVSALGTGFWFLGEGVHSPVDIRKDETDRFDNMIDVMSKTFLGLTVACARCHDHKFDAISSADYYALTGYLQSSDFRPLRFETHHANAAIDTSLAQLDRMMRDRVAKALPISPSVEDEPSFVSAALQPHVVIDYTNPKGSRLIRNGYAFSSETISLGQLRFVDAEVPLRFSTFAGAITDPIWNRLDSIHQDGLEEGFRLGKIHKAGRTLRTPTFAIHHGKVAARVRGSGTAFVCVDSHRLVNGPLHGETVVTIQPESDWVHFALDRYLGHRVHIEFIAAPGQTLDVAMVTTGESDGDRAAQQRHETAIAATIEQSNDELGRAWANDESLQSVKRLVGQWRRQRQQLASRIDVTSHVAITMADGDGEDDHLLIRGDSSNPSDAVPRRFLTAISSEASLSNPVPMGSNARGSGRLELAKRIVDPSNPLTHRVIVNRIWHHLMGRGIVATTDDFGVLGTRPSHAALLDHLVDRFRSGGGSIKSLIRDLVRTRTYRLSGQYDFDSLQADPSNQHWHYRPPRRLTAEQIRDAFLVVSGHVDRTIGGPSIAIHLTPFMTGRGRPRSSGPLDGDGRRSLYIETRRNFLSPFMLAFDAPVPFSSMGRRNVSNVPAQSLALMNNPMVMQQVALLTDRAARETPVAEDRITWLMKTLMSRSPDDKEVRAISEFVSQNKASEAWSEVSHALITAKEFIYVP